VPKLSAETLKGRSAEANKLAHDLGSRKASDGYQFEAFWNAEIAEEIPDHLIALK
jgi:hypothetical protein